MFVPTIVSRLPAFSEIRRSSCGVSDTITAALASHGLGFWRVNFFNTAAARTVKRLRHIVELPRKYLATQQQTETLEKRPEGVLNRQVGELLRSCSPDISASEMAGILNKRYAAEYEPTSPCAVGKTKNWKKHLDEEEKKS